MPVKAPLLLALSSALLLTACASKRPDDRHGPPQGPAMDPARMEEMVRLYTERWDYNNDGAATCDDINVARSRLFRLLDEDKDGQLTSGEYRHAKFEDKSFLFFDFLRIDTNGDGAVSVDELVAVPNSQFMAADKDHDCRISPNEAMASMRESRMGDRSDGGRGKPGARGGDKPPR